YPPVRRRVGAAGALRAGRCRAVRARHSRRLRCAPRNGAKRDLSPRAGAARRMTAALKIMAPGLHTTVQDLGRCGYQAMGVPVSGALDPLSFRLATRLLGNADDAPALEILYQGPTLEIVAERVHVALAGDAVLELVGESVVTVEAWRTLVLERGRVFRVSRLGEACCYLALAGGLAVAPCLGSASTYVRGGLGGFAGRAPQAGRGPSVAGPAPRRGRDH